MKVAGRRYSSRPHLGRCFAAASQPSLMVFTGSSHVQRRQDAHRPLPSRFTRPRGAGDDMVGSIPPETASRWPLQCDHRSAYSKPCRKEEQDEAQHSTPVEAGSTDSVERRKAQDQTGVQSKIKLVSEGPGLALDTPGGMRGLDTPRGYAALISANKQAK